MSQSQDQAPDPQYPDFHDAAEARRLRVQGHLAVNALGGNLILCPLDTSSKGLRILDSATADGHFLTLVREQLDHPETAELIGTDIAELPPLEMPSNITLTKQDILRPWPEKWEAYFDFVHQRTALSVTGDMERAVDAVRRLIALLKPGGWIQIVDTTLPLGEVEEGDKAFVKLLKLIAWSAARLGLNLTLSKSTTEILKRAGDGVLRNIGERQSVSILGKGADSKELEEMGYEELEGMHRAAIMHLQDMPEEERPMTFEELEMLWREVLREAEAGECSMPWYAAWGQKI
ncbi:hypothetical protein V8C26DRAFT_435428 [Trichoderma gracile]